MFDTDPSSIRRVLYACVAAVAVGGGLFVLRAPVLIWLYVPICVALFLFALHVIYVSECFITYARFWLFSMLGALSAFALQGAYGAGEILGLGILFVLVPAALIVAGLWVVHVTKGRSFPFHVQGDRVESEALVFKSSLGVWVGAGVLAATVVSKHLGFLSVNLIVAILGTALVGVQIMYYRDALRGLTTLRAEEKKRGAPFKFINMGHIRDARSKWWIGRLLNMRRR